MSTLDDQPRPDLDAAVAAVVPPLTAVSDEAVAASLRRTRIALASEAPGDTGFGAWRWAVAAVAMTATLLFLTLRLPPSPGEAPRIAVVESSPQPPAAAAPPIAPVPGPPERIASTQPSAPRPDRRRGRAVRATSAMTADAPRPDPLAVLVRAVGTISEEIWTEVLARAEAPLTVPDVPLAPIVVAPFETPAIAETPSDPVALGEP